MNRAVHIEALSDEDFALLYPWRVPVVTKAFALRDDGMERTHEVREWCAEKFMPHVVEKISADTVPPPLPRWWYRYEMGEIDERNMVSFDDVFYFRFPEDAFEFKMRWG